MPTTLYYREGNSDKVYQAAIEPAGDGHIVTTASFMVASVNRRRSVALVLLNGNERVPAGNVTIPPDHDIPEPGEVIEARYLYAFPESGRIYQSVHLGKRDDIDPVDCHVRQLKYKDQGVAA